MYWGLPSYHCVVGFQFLQSLSVQICRMPVLALGNWVQSVYTDHTVSWLDKRQAHCGTQPIVRTVRLQNPHHVRLAHNLCRQYLSEVGQTVQTACSCCHTSMGPDGSQHAAANAPPNTNSEQQVISLLQLNDKLCQHTIPHHTNIGGMRTAYAHQQH